VYAQCLQSCPGVKLTYLRPDHGSPKPHGITLSHVLHNVYFDWSRFLANCYLVLQQSMVHSSLQFHFQSSTEIFNHGASPRKYNVLVQLPSRVDWSHLNGMIYHEIDGISPVLVNELRMEKHFRS
jgi:hypothetical protein